MPLAVFAVALLCVLPGIGRQEIWTRDETRTALVVKEILRTGDWTLPRVAGGLHSRKPPLYHWLTALGAQGRLDETTLRLPAAVAAAGAVTVTHLFGAQLASPAVGLVAAAILVASPGFFEWARTGRMDTLLVFCIVLSLLGLARWLRLGGRFNAVVFGVGIGLGVLTKGPPGLLPLAVAGLALMASQFDTRRVHELALGLACVIVLPLVWLAPAALTAVDFDRYVHGLAPTLANEIARPSTPRLDGVVAMALGFSPWTLLLPGAIVVLARRRPITSPFLVVVLGWVLVVVVVFLGIISSRPVYFLPVYPALALIAAWSWHNAEGRERWWLAAPLGVGIAAVAVAGLASAVRPPTLWFHAASLSVPARVGLIVGAVLLAAGLMALGWRRRGWWPARAIVLAAGVVVTLLALDLGVRVPFYNGLYPVRALVTRLERHIPADAEVAFIDDQRLTALAVRLSRPIRQVASPIEGGPGAAPPSDYVLLTDDLFAELAARWALERVDEVPLRNARYVLARRR
jgi:4-amino-4-deoxy-L-arabinose transferase-like glycosyltransferase